MILPTLANSTIAVMNAGCPRLPMLRPALAVALLALISGPLPAETLREQVQALAKANGIVLEGVERMEDAPAQAASGDAAQRLKSLLADYNFMAVGQGGKLEKLTITSPKQHSPPPKPAGTVTTQRLGSHHQVQAVLTGPNGAAIHTGLLVDTGATTLVLPTSMAAALGFGANNLRDGSSQTAGGTVAVKIGLLQTVAIGDVRAEQVPVSFIPDQKLNGARLLGMSFLNRFRFSLDDGSNELLLQTR